MFKPVLLGLAAFALTGAARADRNAANVSTGGRFEIKKVLVPEGTTVLVFVQGSSTIERRFLSDLEKQTPDDKKIALRSVFVPSLDAPAARQFEVTATPTAIVYDRFGHLLARSSQPEEIKAAVRKGQLLGRIKWYDEDDPKAPEVYGAPKQALQRGLPGIVKTMGMRPEAFKMFNILSEIHFSNGFLQRREHEMVGAYVSALNKCKF